MRTFNQIFTCALFVIVAGCAMKTLVKPPSGWVQIDAREFKFYAPQDIKPVPVQGIDSYVGEYKGDAISLNFDYGGYSDPLIYPERKAYVVHDEQIDGKKARIVSYYDPGTGNPFDFAIGVYFADVNGKGTRLTMYATCKTTNEYQTATMIFRTITFKK
jgi:hypothetical protein